MNKQKLIYNNLLKIIGLIVANVALVSITVFASGCQLSVEDTSSPGSINNLTATTGINDGEVATQKLIDVSFVAKCDQSEQKYIMILPAAFKTNVSHDVLIAFHGHGSDRWQFAKENRDECRAARDIAAKNNMIFVSPDYRAKTSWMGPKAEEDVLQIITD